MGRGVRLLAWAGCLLLGGATGLAAILEHARWWGLALGLAASLAAVSALPRGAPRLAFVLGWVGMLVLALVPRPEGDFLVASTPEGYLLLAAAPLLLAVAVVTSLRPPHREPDDAGVGSRRG